jgi:hypothetical protein
MTWGEWLVPRPSLAAEARLQHDIATVRKTRPSDVASLIGLTERLLQQNMLYATLLRQATHHIALIETEQALRGE